MNSASKVGEIFLAAGTAYSKLGEVNHLYHLTSCGTTQRQIFFGVSTQNLKRVLSSIGCFWAECKPQIQSISLLK